MKLSLGAVLVMALGAIAAGCAADPAGAEGGDGDPASAASAANDAATYEKWARIVRAKGVALHRGGRAAVVGVRGTSMDGTQHAVQSKRGNDDGAKDVGMIDPGVYVAVGRGARNLIAGHAAFDVKLASNGSGRLPGVRDTNHDGVFDEEERAASARRSDGLTAVLFHHGDADAPPAVGCQVFADGPMREFVRAVGGASATFDYVLVDRVD